MRSGKSVSDADPETLDAWCRRTPDQIAAEKADRWNAAWSALRMPDNEAYEPEGADPSGGDVATTGDAVDTAARSAPPVKNAWASQDLGFLDVLASGESNQGDGGYDVLATQTGRPLRHLAPGADGRPDYSKFPDEPLQYVADNGRHVYNSSAGRFQFKTKSWKDVVRSHPDVSDFSPLNQNKAAWYRLAR